MTQLCTRCSRANPQEAAYCYYDGAALAGHAGQGGPVKAGAQPFPSQFVFPSGQACRNFDELALACQNNWQAAVDLLKQGFLSGFLGGLGRADLALAAQEAARFPDHDRGLDQLLDKLPSQALAAPKLKVEPSEINLGQLAMGADRTIELHLANQGSRLLYGSAVSDSKWLTLGETPGNPQKLFQFGHESAIQVHVRGQHLRAGNKPLEGRLVIESNGGTATVVIRADVAIKPYPDGVLAGALTPRQIAEKAKASPGQAAPFFEKGAVAQWFQSNGWTYPVQGPNASGLGAVQQFFEALGLAKAPKVEVPTKSITLRGGPGQSLQATIDVTTPEKKPIYAHATADQAWVDVSKVKLAGRSAVITVLIPTVPNQPGETLNATINVQGNGNQRFQVPLTLTVEGTAPPPGAEVTMAMEPRAAAELSATLAGASAIKEAPDFSLLPPGPAVADGSPFADLSAPGSGPAAAPAPSLVGASADSGAVAARPRRGPRPVWMHLLPLAVLGIALLALLLRDFLGGAAAEPGFGGYSDDEIDHTRRLGLTFNLQSPDPKTKKGTPGWFTFGLVEIDPKNPGNPDLKKLTFYHDGTSNSVVVRIDGIDRLLGYRDGKWKGAFANYGRFDGKMGTWDVSPEPVQVIQKVEIIPGEPVEGIYKRLLDTCLVRYEIVNKGSRAYRVGLRFVLDTYIGSNDGVPFTIPGTKNLVDTAVEFPTAKEVPDFIEALEKPNLENPGTIARANLRLGGKLESPGRVLLTQWPGRIRYLDKWDIPLLSSLAEEKDFLKNPKKFVPSPDPKKRFDDSSIVLYWPEEKLEPGKSRELGFTYGLGNVAASAAKGGQLGITVGGSFTLNGELTVVALVIGSGKDQTVTLDFPKDKFALLEGSSAMQKVPKGRESPDNKIYPAPITWRLRAIDAGQHEIKVQTSDGLEQSRRITINRVSIF